MLMLKHFWRQVTEVDVVLHTALEWLRRPGHSPFAASPAEDVKRSVEISCQMKRFSNESNSFQRDNNNSLSGVALFQKPCPVATSFQVARTSSPPWLARSHRREHLEKGQSYRVNYVTFSKLLLNLQALDWRAFQSLQTPCESVIRLHLCIWVQMDPCGSLCFALWCRRDLR